MLVNIIRAASLNVDGPLFPPANTQSWIVVALMTESRAPVRTMMLMSRQAALDVEEELIDRRHWSHIRAQKLVKRGLSAIVEQANLEKYEHVKF